MVESWFVLFLLLIVSQITSYESFRCLAFENGKFALLPAGRTPSCALPPGSRGLNLRFRALDAAELPLGSLTTKSEPDVNIEKGYKPAVVVVKAVTVRPVSGKEIAAPSVRSAPVAKIVAKEKAIRTATSTDKLKKKVESDGEVPFSVAKVVALSVATVSAGVIVTAMMASTSYKKVAPAFAALGVAALKSPVAVKKIKKKTKSVAKTGKSPTKSVKSVMKSIKPLTAVKVVLSTPQSAKANSKQLSEKSAMKDLRAAASVAVDVQSHLTPKSKNIKVAVTDTAAATATAASTRGTLTAESVKNLISGKTVSTGIKPGNGASKSQIASTNRPAKAAARAKAKATATVNTAMTGVIKVEKKVTWANMKVGIALF